MMKALLLVLGLLLIAACSTPPAEVPKAVVEDTAMEKGTDDTMEQQAMEDDAMKDHMDGEAMEQMDNGQMGDDGAMDDAMDKTAQGAVPIDPAKSSFEFEGYGVGKSHVGTFEEMSGTVTLEDGMIVAAEGVIQAASVKSDSGGLDKHLMNEDFFDVEVYPTIEFSSSEISETEMVGSLTFHGVTRDLTIPLSESGETLTAEFLLSMKEYGIEYTGVNDEVRIAFTVTN